MARVDTTVRFNIAAVATANPSVVPMSTFVGTVGTVGAVTHGSQIGASNTGVPSGTSLTSSAPNFTTSAGTYTDLSFTGSSFYTMTADGSTFTRCRFTQHVFFDRANNHTFVDCDFQRGWSMSTSTNNSFLRCNITGSADVTHITGDQPANSQCADISLTECWVHGEGAASYNITGGFAPGDGPHIDGVQVRGCNRLTIVRSRYDMGDWFTLNNSSGNPEDVLNAAYFPEGGNGGNSNLDIRDNHFAGGGFIMYHRAYSGTYVFTGNSFGDVGGTPVKAAYGRIDNAGAAPLPTSMSGNYILSTGQPIAIPTSGSV